MKTFLLTALLALMAMPVMAAEGEHQHGDGWLKPVEAKFVCMMNDKAFEKEQMAIEIDGKTYYGCCPMCKDMLSKDAEKRAAIDPVSKNKVDKAGAVIGADPRGMTYYFENEENFHKFASGPMPEMKHDHMDGMDMHGMMDEKSAEDTGAGDPAVKQDDHKDHH